jgi:hypothetical protein
MPRDVSPLWITEPFSGRADGVWGVTVDGIVVFASHDRRNAELAVNCVNLVGKDIDRPGVAAAVKAIGGMGEHELEMLTDLLKEKGWME